MKPVAACGFSCKSAGILAVMFCLATPSPLVAQSCEELRESVNSSYETYLGVHLDYLNAQYSRDTIVQWRSDTADETLLKKRYNKATQAIEQLELDREQAENDYHAARYAYQQSCPDG